MQSRAYAAIDAAREEFRRLVEEWSDENPYLLDAQERLRKKLGYDDYRVETPIVYNGALDDISRGDEIKVVLVADNPGKREQLAANRRYLVGQSGKLAEGWFGRELGVDFRREVLILNKTPVHTPKTAELALLPKSSGGRGDEVSALIAGSQAAMADIAWRLYRALRAGRRRARGGTAGAGGSSPWPVLWISGVGELKPRGLFATYRDELFRRLEAAEEDERGGTWAFNHFSMNQFSVELKRKARPSAPHLDELARIGVENRERVFGI